MVDVEIEKAHAKFDQWWKSIAGSIGTVAAGIGSVLGIREPYNIWIAAIVVAAGLVLLYGMYRRDARQKEVEERRKAAEANLAGQKPAGAFRNLRRYRMSEFLPGPNRRHQGLMLETDVKAPDFKLSVVVGESGAGKSSLLEASLATKLQEAGFIVVLINNVLRLDKIQTSASIGNIVEAIENEFSKQSAGKTGTRTICILDQFEELLSRFQSDADRAELGKYLQSKSAAGVGLVIGMRKEYIADLNAVVSQLSFPVGYSEFFQVLNFDVAEAAAVIRECAEKDGVDFDPDLPAMIAKDLSVDGRVRPAALQIVCGALASDRTALRYQREGGAVGLQSRFISEFIDVTGDPVLARTVLRELCDIPNNKKAAEPLTAGEISRRAQSSAPGARATVQAVELVLNALMGARIVVADKISQTVRWSLIHDYLARPIALATEQQTTLSETAARKLDYYLVECAKRTLGTIPLKELIDIRRNAPPTKLSQPDARKLIRRSMALGYGKPVTRATGIAAVAGIVLLAFATQRGQWQVVDKMSHWQDEARTGSPLYATLIPGADGRTILALTTGFMDVAKVTIWDPKSGRLIATHDGEMRIEGGWIWNFDPQSRTLSRIDPENPQAKTNVVLDVISANGIRVKSWNDPYLRFESASPDFSRTSVVNFETGALKHLDQDKMQPLAGSYSMAPGLSNSVDLGIASVESVDNFAVFRLSVIAHDFTIVHSEEYDGDKKRTAMKGLRPENDVAYLFTLRSGNEKTEFRVLTVTLGKGEIKVVSGPWVSTERLRSDLLDFDWFGPPAILSSAARIWIRSSDNKIMVWEPALSRFAEDYAVEDLVLVNQGTGMKPDSGVRGWAWKMPGQGKWSILLDRMAKPVVFETLDLRGVTAVTISSDGRIALTRRPSGADVWEIDLKHGTSKLLKSIDGTGLSDIYFSSDESAILTRTEGGYHKLWHRDGGERGDLGTVGAQIIWSSYDADCRRLLIWDADGQRLDFRRGFSIPIIGFVPEKSCAAEASWPRRLLDAVIP